MEKNSLNIEVEEGTALADADDSTISHVLYHAELNGFEIPSYEEGGEIPIPKGSYYKKRIWDGIPSDIVTANESNISKTLPFIVVRLTDYHVTKKDYLKLRELVLKYNGFGSFSNLKQSNGKFFTSTDFSISVEKNKLNAIEKGIRIYFKGKDIHIDKYEEVGSTYAEGGEIPFKIEGQVWVTYKNGEEEVINVSDDKRFAKSAEEAEERWMKTLLEDEDIESVDGSVHAENTSTYADGGWIEKFPFSVVSYDGIPQESFTTKREADREVKLWDKEEPSQKPHKVVPSEKFKDSYAKGGKVKSKKYFNGALDFLNY